VKFLSKSALLAYALAAPFPLAAFAAEPLQVGATFLVGSTDPTNGSAGWALTSHGVGENLFTVDRDGMLVPQLAVSAERTGDLTWTVKLAPDRIFSNGEPVTAAALKEGFDNTIARNPAAAATGGKLSFAAPDLLTLEVTTEKPVPRLEALFAEWPLIAYTLADDGAPVFTAPYAIADLEVDQRLDLVPNAHFTGAEKRSPIALRKFGDAQTMALAFEAGELDLAFGLPAESLSRLKADPELTVKSFPVGYQYFGFLNTERPALSDVKIRQAVDLAIDRSELVTAIDGGQPATGAFAPYFPFAAKDARPTDLARAEALLDEAGWTKTDDGMRARDGAPLRLLAVAYPQRPDLVTMLPVIKAALARVGIAVDTQVAENVGAVAAAGDFDILLWAQHTAPAGDPAFFFNAMLRSDAELNYAHYASDAFDGIVAGFATAAAEADRTAIALAAQEQLFEDAPVTFLVSPEWHVGLSKRLAGYEPWGSDYYVIRADMGEAD
jgi:peptide/nickel transport system substrate-binding protein